MGVPAFYRWLSDKYPKIILDVVEQSQVEVDGVLAPIDATAPNPNGIEFDNLYLDMNGIIHPCFHPEDRPAPTTVDEVFECIFDYIDRLFNMIRPRKVLYMAIDGVAPRAKMNQQRSRRFRAVQDAKEAKEEEAKLREEFRRAGMEVPEKPATEAFDSNVITPGTPFMAKLSAALAYYVHVRLNTNPAWKNVKVILSDANVPGEGEHKIMDYVRRQRGLPGHDPNTKHVLYGLDADLIMLGLATHEAHFHILREIVFIKNAKQNVEEKLLAANKQKTDLEAEAAAKQFEQKPYQIVVLQTLREYLQLELHVPDLPFEDDKERLIDDFVFMCFFCGNDFLPHMPTLEIREGAIELLMTTYKRVLPELGGYLCEGGDASLERVAKFMGIIGQYEEQIFSKRSRIAARQRERRRHEKMRDRSDLTDMNVAPPAAFVARAGRGRPDEMKQYSVPGRAGGLKRPGAPSAEAAMAAAPPPPPQSKNQSAAERLREAMRKAASLKKRPAQTSEAEAEAKRAKVEGGSAKDEEAEVGAFVRAPESGGKKKKSKGKEGAPGADAEDAQEKKPATNADMDALLVQPEAAAGKKSERERELDAKAEAEFKERLSKRNKDRTDMIDSITDEIQLDQQGWRERYYNVKFGTMDVREDVVRTYVEGLCWTLKYYYEGCVSWTWYFPYHYAPFASDLADCGKLDISFSLGTPFRPFDQLMGVLPAASSHCLPEPYRELMSEPTSPIIDFYPTEFKVDMNGKRFAWQGVALLPFIDEKRLLEATKPVHDTLGPEETRRNSNLTDVMYISSQHPLAKTIERLYDRHGHLEGAERAAAQEIIDPSESEGMNGFLRLTAASEAMPASMRSPVGGMPDIGSNKTMGVVYVDPPKQKHVCHLLEGAVLNEPTMGRNAGLFMGGNMHAGARQMINQSLGQGQRQSQGGAGASFPSQGAAH
eukprot:PRCOL_00000528-RA